MRLRRVLQVMVATLMLMGTASTPAYAAEVTIGKSVDRPATTFFKGRLIGAWSDQPVRIGDGGIMVAQNSQGVWGPAARVPTVSRSNSGPGLATLGDRLYVAWREGTELFVTSTADLSTWSPRVRAVPDGVADSSPSLATVGDRIQMAWRGPDSGLYTAWTLDGLSWSPTLHAAPDGGGTEDPSLIMFAGKLQLTWKGLGDDTRMFISRSVDGEHWDAQAQAAPVGRTSSGPHAVDLGIFMLLSWRNAADDAVYYSFAEFNGIANQYSWRGPSLLDRPNSVRTRTTPVFWGNDGDGDNRRADYLTNRPGGPLTVPLISGNYRAPSQLPPGVFG